MNQLSHPLYQGFTSDHATYNARTVFLKVKPRWWGRLRVRLGIWLTRLAFRVLGINLGYGKFILGGRVFEVGGANEDVPPVKNSRMTM